MEDYAPTSYYDEVGYLLFQWCDYLPLTPTERRSLATAYQSFVGSWDAAKQIYDARVTARIKAICR